MTRSPLHSILLMFLYLTIGSAVGAFVALTYFPRVEVREIIKDGSYSDLYPCATPDTEGKG